MKKILIIVLTFAITLIFAGCSGEDKIPAGLGPFVKATFPSDGSHNVSTDVNIIVYFSEPVSPKSVEKLLSLMAGNLLIQNIGFNWSQNNEILTLVMPGNAGLEPSTEYTLTILKGFEDRKGRLSDKTFSMKFYTGFNVIPVNFNVLAVSPLDGTENVPQFAGQHFKVTFSDCVDPGTITNSNIFIAQAAGGKVVSADLIISTHLKEVTIINKSALAVNSGYTITVKGVVANNRVPSTTLGTDFVSTFVTGNYQNQASELMIKSIDGTSNAGTKKTALSSGYHNTDTTESKNYQQSSK